MSADGGMTAATQPAVPAAVRRVLRLILALSGHTFNGVRLKQIADLVEELAPTTLRDLKALEVEGWAERIPGAEERWRLSPRPAQIAHAHQQEMRRLSARVEDLTNRYSREP